MAYQLIDNGRAKFAVDWDVVDRLLLAAARAELRDAYSRVVRASESTWYNPFSWSLPEIASVEVDWDQVQSKAPEIARYDGQRMRQIAQRDARAMALEVQGRVEFTSRLTNGFLDRMAAVQSENTVSISRSVESYDNQIEVAKFVRDTSADGLMVGATMLTGGAATAVIAGGSAFKGYAKFQDTDNVGAAVMEGAGSFVFGYFPMGKTMTGKQEAVFVLVQAAWETGTGLVEGKEMADAMTGGSMKFLGAGADKLLGSQAVTNMISRAPIPMKVWVPVGPGHAVDMASDFAQKLGGEVFKKQVVERYGPQAVEAMRKTGNGTPKPAGRRGCLLRTATTSEDLLLKFAIINMEKGAGHGW